MSGNTTNQKEFTVYDAAGNPEAGQAVEGFMQMTLDAGGKPQAASASTPIPVQVISSLAGGGISDLLFTDDTGAQFVYRDSGAVPPVFTAYLIPAGTAYTVGSNPRPYAVKNVGVADGADITQGALADVAVTTDAAGSVSAKLRGIVKLLAAKLGVTSADGDLATVGVTTGAAVVTDAAGTLQQYSRGFVKLLASVINGTASALQVSGTAAVGAAPTGYPLTVAGVSPDGNKRYFLVGTAGDTYSSAGVVSDTGVFVPIDSLAHTLTPAAPPTTGTQTDAVSWATHTFTQTLTYSGGYLASWSQWVQS